MFEHNHIINVLKNESNNSRNIKNNYEKYHFKSDIKINNFNIKMKDCGDRFTILLTHDIDKIYPTNLEIISRLFKQKVLIGKTVEQNPYWTFNKIIELEKKYSVNSTWFLKSSGKPYTLNNNLKKEIKKILKARNEIGLHADFDSFNNLTKLQIEKTRLEKFISKKICGVRNHHLLFDVHKTWEIQQKSGFKYDSTFGFPDRVGYRNGSCVPFKAYSLDKNKFLDLMVFPLTVMDCSLMSYLKLNYSDSLEKIKELMDVVKIKKGLIVINWHNDYFSDILHKNSFLLYRKILEYANKLGAWMPTMNEYYKFIQK